MKKLILFLSIVFAFQLFGANDGSDVKINRVNELKYREIKTALQSILDDSSTFSGAKTFSGAVTFSGTVTNSVPFDLTVTGVAAGGDKAVNVSVTEGSSALTGNLIAGAFVATNGTAAASSGVIYGIEAKARAATSGGTGNTIGRLTGVYASVDAKTKTATIMRAFEASLDGGAGGTSTEAVAFEAFNNSSATQTASYAFSANGGTASGHKAYTADFRMQNGELIQNNTDGAIAVVGALNHSIAGGTPIISAGLLGGAGTSTSAYQTVGAGGSGQKAFSFYVGSTSVTASHALTGYYMNVNYGTVGTSPAPSGDALRGRAYLIGDQAGAVAVTGMSGTLEIASGGSVGGLGVGTRGNIVYPNEAQTGTMYGMMAELYSGGTSTDMTTAVVTPLEIAISGTIDATKWANVPAFRIDVPASLVSTSAYILDTDAAGDDCDAKLKININGTDWWVLLSNTND